MRSRKKPVESATPPISLLFVTIEAFALAWSRCFHCLDRKLRRRWFIIYVSAHRTWSNWKMIRFLQTKGRLQQILLVGFLSIICIMMVVTLIPGGSTLTDFSRPRPGPERGCQNRRPRDHVAGPDHADPQLRPPAIWRPRRDGGAIHHAAGGQYADQPAHPAE